MGEAHQQRSLTLWTAALVVSLGFSLLLELSLLAPQPQPPAPWGVHRTFAERAMIFLLRTLAIAGPLLFVVQLGLRKRRPRLEVGEWFWLAQPIAFGTAYASGWLFPQLGFEGLAALIFIELLLGVAAAVCVVSLLMTGNRESPAAWAGTLTCLCVAAYFFLDLIMHPVVL